jgi:hypothetical protein
MDGSPREAEARDQPEVTFEFQKNWHLRMGTIQDKISNGSGKVLHIKVACHPEQ